MKVFFAISVLLISVNVIFGWQERRYRLQGSGKYLNYEEEPVDYLVTTPSTASPPSSTKFWENQDSEGKRSIGSADSGLYMCLDDYDYIRGRTNLDFSAEKCRFTFTHIGLGFYTFKTSNGYYLCETDDSRIQASSIDNPDACHFYFE